MIPEALRAHLRRLTGDGGAYLLGGVACRAADGREAAFLTGRTAPGDAARDRPDLLSHRLRVASITKAATARLAAELADLGALDLEAPIGPVLRPLGYPAALTVRAITLAHLLGHTSGLTDSAGYVTDPPDTLPGFLSRAGDGWLTRHPPGAWFYYANLNHVLAGAVIEAATGTRFDRLLATHVLGPLGLGGGLNWAGVPRDARARHLPLYQRHGDAWQLEADGAKADWDADLIWRGGRGVPLSDYRTGCDTYLFSPHAGLRLSLPELARLARSFGDDTAPARACRAPRWRFDGGNGAWSDGLFPEVGLALTTYRGHDRIPGHLVGHAGHALGFTGGAWCDLATGTGWAYALTGAADETEGIDEEVFFPPAELAIFRAMAR